MSKIVCKKTYVPQTEYVKAQCTHTKRMLLKLPFSTIIYYLYCQVHGDWIWT